MPLGGIITLAVLLPNLLILKLPPRDVPPEANKENMLWRVMEAIERAGQLGVFLIPFFYPLPPLRDTSVDALAVMVLALLFYYSSWVRYAAKGHRFVLLYAPFLGVPLPMAIGPIVYFFAAAVFLNAWPLMLATLFLAAGHIFISYGCWMRCRLENESALFPARRG